MNPSLYAHANGVIQPVRWIWMTRSGFSSFQASTYRRIMTLQQAFPPFKERMLHWSNEATGNKFPVVIFSYPDQLLFDSWSIYRIPRKNWTVLELKLVIDLIFIRHGFISIYISFHFIPFQTRKACKIKAIPRTSSQTWEKLIHDTMKIDLDFGVNCLQFGGCCWWWKQKKEQMMGASLSLLLISLFISCISTHNSAKDRWPIVTQSMNLPFNWSWQHINLTIINYYHPAGIYGL